MTPNLIPISEMEGGGITRNEHFLGKILKFDLGRCESELERKGKGKERRRRGGGGGRARVGFVLYGQKPF